MTIWFTSDTHFSQASMVRGGAIGNRPQFSTAEEMDEALVARWNALVKPSDHVYHLGDVAMAREALAIVKRLNGHKRLVGGNHDIYSSKDYHAIGFENIFGVRVIDKFLFTHIPVDPGSANPKTFRANVHGHVHRNKPLVYRLAFPGHLGNATGFVETVTYINLSTEQTNYAPVTLEDLHRFLRRGVL